jgi:hypothetical protein
MSNNDTVTLDDGSEIDADIFENLESSLAEEDPESFQENRFTRRKSDDPVTPFTAEPLPTASNVAQKRHAERSERAQHVDEEYNAPIAPDYETWQKNPNRYDLPGVDTIPQSERDRRGREAAESAKEAGLIDTVEETSLGGNMRGKFTTDDPRALPTGEQSERKIQKEADLDDEYPVFQEGPVLAHETGHAIDFAVGGENTESFGSEFDFFEGREEDLEQEARTLTKRLRGSISPGEQAYREDNRELVADAFAAMAIEPRAAKREAPNLTEALRTEFAESIDDEGQLPF